MSHPYHHAVSSAKKWGGTPEDYLPIHNWFDETKACFADFRHRALRHHVPLIVKYSSQVKTSWRKLVRFLIRECNGIATLEQLYGMAMGHPKTAANSNWKAKIRQQVQKEARRIGPALYELQPDIILQALG